MIIGSVVNYLFIKIGKGVLIYRQWSIYLASLLASYSEQKVIWRPK